MNSFKSKYPAVAAFILLFADIGKTAANTHGSLLQKLGAEAAIFPEAIAAIPQASNLGPELEQIKKSPEEITAAAELLVMDLAFSSDKAQAIIPLAFDAVEKQVSAIEAIAKLIESAKA